jgi:hypothetical protein
VAAVVSFSMAPGREFQTGQQQQVQRVALLGGDLGDVDEPRPGRGRGRVGGGVGVLGVADGAAGGLGLAERDPAPPEHGGDVALGDRADRVFAVCGRGRGQLDQA